ncbi:MAG: hypothetical protein AAF531_02315 [Actinomycetota bacterium]
MSQSGRIGDRAPRDPITVAVLVIGVGWLLLALIAMLISTSPDLGPIGGSAQHLLLGVVLAVLSGTALAMLTDRPAPTVAWAAVVITGMLLTVYELLQLAVPVRAFQWVDLSYGMTGMTVGGLVVLLGLRWRTAFASGVAGFGGVALVLAAVGLVTVPDDNLGVPTEDRLAACPPNTPTDRTAWERAVLRLTGSGSGCISAGQTTLVPFGAGLGAPEADDGVVLEGGGLRSATLDGLADAIERSDALTFGLRFTSTIQDDDLVPVVLARLTADGDPAIPIAQLLQRGPHLTVNVGSGRPIVGVGIPLADRANPGTAQELVVTYRAGVAVAFLDGREVGRSRIEPFDFELDGELTLEVGWRVDERWRAFSGSVDAVVIADQALDTTSIPEIFDRE